MEYTLTSKSSLNKNIKKTKTILILLSLIWLITNAADCGGNKNPEPITCTEENTVKFPQDALDRFYFKEGSYWVYTDSATQLMYDSVWVYRHTWGASSKKENGHFKNKCYAGGGINYEYLGGLDVVVTFSPFREEGVENIPYSQERFRIILSNLVDGTSTINRFHLNGNEYDIRFTGEVSFQDSMKVNFTKYNDVLKLHYPIQHSDFLNDGYWAKNVGLIKYTDLNGTVWQITKSQIIQ